MYNRTYIDMGNDGRKHVQDSFLLSTYIIYNIYNYCYYYQTRDVY